MRSSRLSLRASLSRGNGNDVHRAADRRDRGVIIANDSDMPNYEMLVTRNEADATGPFLAGDPRAAESASSAEGAGARTGTPFITGGHHFMMTPPDGALPDKR
jgi:hypothetical protein